MINRNISILVTKTTVHTVPITGSLFAKRADVLRQDLVKASKPRDSSLDSPNRSEIWQAPRQQCCRDAFQISERYDHYNTKSRGFETSRDLAVSHLVLLQLWNDDFRLGTTGLQYSLVNTLRPKQNGRQYSDIFKCIFLMKIYEFRLRFHWIVFPRVQLTTFQHWFR